MSFREEADWDADPEADAWFCAGCRRGQGCNGDARCATQAEDLGPAQGPYDATKAPPALLSPSSVWRNRRRTDLYRATGLCTWPRPTDYSARLATGAEFLTTKPAHVAGN